MLIGAGWRGPNDGAHQESALGVQIGDPLTSQFPNGAPWTFNPFVQLTDVDRFGALGLFHYWQPYAQIGAQFRGPGSAHPTLTGNLFPLNLGFDVGESLTLTLGGGFVLNLDLSSGKVAAGPQLTAGVNIKFGKAK